MIKRTPPPSKIGEVPMWFMTYSDVITLLMTFFILLLTFATNEPESFERIKTSVFGGNRSDGVAGTTSDGDEKDSWVVRVRPRSGRMTLRGSETPPIEMDAPENALDDGLAGLERDEERDLTRSFRVKFPAAHVGTPDGKLYNYAKVQLNMIARVLHHEVVQVTFEISNEAQFDRVLSAITFMREGLHVDQGSLAVELVPPSAVDANTIQIVLESHRAPHE